jgi:nucleotide-binding universal stress UspA family protein
MSKILVPVDFTKASMAAINYAWQFASSIGGEITLLHVIQAGFTSADPMLLDTLDAAMVNAKERLQNFVEECKKLYHVASIDSTLSSEVRFGVPGFTIADMATDLAFDYVITGMRDHHSFVDKMVGTTSAIVVKNCQCPVILIHENTPWRIPAKIIFTIDQNTDFDESVSAFRVFNSIFNASTDFIHIKQVDDANFPGRDAVLHELFTKKPPAFSFTIKSITGGDIIQSIVDYTLFEKADLIVMVHRKKSFLNSVFKRSMSLSTAEGIHLPVVILAETNLSR